MSDSELARALGPLIERLLSVAARDAGLREDLRSAARQVLAALADPPADVPATAADPGTAPNYGPSRDQVVDATSPGDDTRGGEPASPATARPSADRGRTTAAALPPVPLSGPRVVSMPRDDGRHGDWADPPRAGPAGDDVTDADLPLVEARCRMKADGCRWAATRRRRLAAGADFRVEVEPMDREIVERAKKLPDCFLWMNHPTGPAPADPGVLDAAAACFDVVADAIAATRAALADPERADEYAEPALALLAEAQSTLRTAVAQTGHGPDKDQLRSYHWLRGACWARQVYLSRYMRLEDAADPANCPDLAARVQAFDALVQSRQQQVKQVRAALNRIRYHLKPILAAAANGGVGGGGGGGGGDDRRHDWQVIADTADRLVADGVPPSNVELRDLLLPVIDRVPDGDVPRGFGLVLREIDRFLADRPAEDDGPPPTPDQTEAVRRVAAVLNGKTVVMIGGVPRPHARQALERAFGLAELDWVGTREHESIAPFEPHVARAGVAVVLLAIRWSSHSFEGVKAFCEAHGKPLVRLPAGYHPNQVAEQILRQCGGALGA